MKKKEKFYITTPIYYVNWPPHIWHFYTSLVVSVIARYNKILWKEVKFTTWTDENSQKTLQMAKEKNMKIIDYLDEVADTHKQVRDFFAFPYNDFIRTTETRHHNLVREVLQKIYEIWDIYKWVYEWMYCLWCEAFKKEDDLFLDTISKEKICPDHLKTPQKIKEKNYFFKLQRYQTWLEGFYEKNPEFIIPDFRFNEVKEFVKRWLEDFSVSRETNKFWVKLPFDETQVSYVWFDALFNYYTSCKYPNSFKFSPKKLWETKDIWNDLSFWSPDLQVVWKDIIRFHGIYWPVMLASYFWLWEEKNWILKYKESDKEKLPQQILTTWFFTIDGQKISKTIWNVIEPVEYSKKYSKELLTLYIFSAFPIWNDGDFDKKQAILTYNSKLANNLWNLVNRVIVLSLKLETQNWKLDSGIKDEKIISLLSYLRYSFFYILTEKQDKDIVIALKKTWENIKTPSRWKFYDYDLKWILDEIFFMLDKLNKYVDENEPWKLINDNKNKAGEVLYTTAEWLRQVWLYLYPFFPEKMQEMFEKFWLKNYSEILENWWLEELLEKKEVFFIKEKWKVLFERFDVL